VSSLIASHDLAEYRSLRPLFLSLWPGNQREVDRLRQMREELANEIGECIGKSTSLRQLSSTDVQTNLVLSYTKTLTNPVFSLLPRCLRLVVHPA